MCYHRRGLCRVSTEETTMVKHVKVIVEKHPDGYVAYPLGLKGVIVGEGDTYEEALADVQSAMTFHRETLRNVRRRSGGGCLLRAGSLRGRSRDFPLMA